jgi:uncharacterized protein (TIGR03000 family)
MRNKLLTLAVATILMVASASDVYAQRRGGGGGRRGGGARISVGNRGGGYYGGRGYNRGYYGGGYGYGGLGYGYGGLGYGGLGYGGLGYGGLGYGGLGYGGRGYGSGYGGLGYGSGYGGSSYYSSPSYTDYGTPAYDARQSFYSDPVESQQTAVVNVFVPMPNAQVWFDGTQTSQQGTERTFHSPPLENGYNYSYTIKARWTENGKAVDRERRVTVQPGQTVAVNFRTSAGESVPSPRP